MKEKRKNKTKQKNTNKKTKKNRTGRMEAMTKGCEINDFVEHLS